MSNNEFLYIADIISSFFEIEIQIKKEKLDFLLITHWVHIDSFKH